MQPPPPPRRRRRSTRAAGPSRPAEPDDGSATGGRAGTGPHAATPGRPAAPPVDPPDEVATEPYRVVDQGADLEDRSTAPVVPPSPPPADGPRRPARSPGSPGQDPEPPADGAQRPPRSPGGGSQDPGRFGRWPTGARRARPARDESGERSLRALVTSRTTQLPPSTALRAREVEVPSDDELARAEAELVIVRRNYVPPTALPTGRRSARGRPGEDRGRRRATEPPPTD